MVLMFGDGGCAVGCGAAVTAALVSALAVRRTRRPREDAVAATKTVYFVRHGEAVHNVAEKSARRCSIKQLEKLEVNAGSDVFEDIVEGARIEVLRAPSFHDAPLSEFGQDEASKALSVIEDLQSKGYSPPTTIFVSPLQRALKTAAIVFPQHPRIVVNEDLRERMTGLPCDNKSPTDTMSRRLSFQGMVWDLVRDKSKASRSSAKHSTDPGPTAKTEDKSTLRNRARKALVQVLASKDASIAVVSHKGFLRELEQGTLGVPNATEFGNCEVRVYDIALQAGGNLVATRRFPVK